MHPETRELIAKANSLKDHVFQIVHGLIPPNSPAAQQAFEVWQHAADMAWKHPENEQVHECAEQARADLVAAYGESDPGSR